MENTVAKIERLNGMERGDISNLAVYFNYLAWSLYSEPASLTLRQVCHFLDTFFDPEIKRFAKDRGIRWTPTFHVFAEWTLMEYVIAEDMFPLNEMMLAFYGMMVQKQYNREGKGNNNAEFDRDIEEYILRCKTHSVGLIDGTQELKR
jgi:hypothetical protein